jgi:hypothetical protein
MLELECGHKALAFGGNIKQLSGVLFCMQCNAKMTESGQI